MHKSIFLKIFYNEIVDNEIRLNPRKISNVISPESNRNICVEDDAQVRVREKDKVILKTKESFHEYYYNLKKRRNFLFDISFCLLFKYRLCPGRLSKNEGFLMNLFIKSRNIIDKKMDVVEYLKFVFEYVNLKYVLFSDINSLCLQFANKPNLMQNSRLDIFCQKKIAKTEDIVRYFTKKVGELSEEEKKLYEILSDDIKELIKAFK